MKMPEKLPEGKERQGSGSLKGNLMQGPRWVEGVGTQSCLLVLRCRGSRAGAPGIKPFRGRESSFVSQVQDTSGWEFDTAQMLVLLQSGKLTRRTDRSSACVTQPQQSLLLSGLSSRYNEIFWDTVSGSDVPTLLPSLSGDAYIESWISGHLFL